MADERRQTLGLLAAWQVAQVVTRIPFTAELLDPKAINPFGPGKSEAMQRLEAWQRARGMRALGEPAARARAEKEAAARGITSG